MSKRSEKRKIQTESKSKTNKKSYDLKTFKYINKMLKITFKRNKKMSRGT